MCTLSTSHHTFVCRMLGIRMHMFIRISISCMSHSKIALGGPSCNRNLTSLKRIQIQNNRIKSHHSNLNWLLTRFVFPSRFALVWSRLPLGRGCIFFLSVCKGMFSFSLSALFRKRKKKLEFKPSPVSHEMHILPYVELVINRKVSQYALRRMLPAFLLSDFFAQKRYKYF